MDKKELTEYILNKMPKQLSLAQREIMEITQFYLGTTVDKLCKRIENMPKNNQITNSIVHGIIIAIIESATQNTDEMLEMFNEAKKSVIRIETEFNKT